MPPTTCLLPDLDPANNADDKRKFFMRVRSQMIVQALEGILVPESWIQLMIQKKVFIQYTSTGNEYLDGVIMVKVLIDYCNPDTKVSIHILRTKISKTKPAAF